MRVAFYPMLFLQRAPIQQAFVSQQLQLCDFRSMVVFKFQWKANVKLERGLVTPWKVS